jgi:predicted small secreted protein
MTKRLVVPATVLALLSGLALAGCNTVSGMGEDISAAGRGIDQTSQATEKKVFPSSKPAETQSGSSY